MQLFLKTLSRKANSADADQTDLDLHCLHMPLCKKLWCTKFQVIYCTPPPHLLPRAMVILQNFASDHIGPDTSG